MPKKIISFVQTNFPTGVMYEDVEENHFFPYSAGCVWSYAYKFNSIKDQWDLGDFIFRRDPLDDVVNKLSQCSVVGFSTYVWNKNYNYQLAKLLKQKNPNCLLVFGGPEIPVTKNTLFETIPEADIVVVNEGEKTFKAILDAYGTTYDHIPGIIINQGGSAYSTGPPVRIDELDEIPSPYLSGVFDKLISDNPDVRWNATLETNRGCPYQCTFCDWGSLTYSKVKKFDMDRVREEIEWFGKKGCNECYIIDANLGIFFERDSQIIDWAIDTRNKFGLPNVYNLSWAKNQQENVVKLAHKMISAGLLSPGVITSVQSLDPNVLDVIKRKNLDSNKIEEICEYCNRYNIPLTTELILGLPGETLLSWKHNYYKLFELGNHHGLDVSPAQILENSEMNLQQRGPFKLESVYVQDYFKNRKTNDTVNEGLNVIVSTSTLPVDDMRQAHCFSWYMWTTHLSGTTSLLARFVRKYCNESYENFYTKLYDHLQSDNWFVKEEEEIKQFYDNWRLTGYTHGPTICGMKLSGETVKYKSRMRLLESNKTDEFIDFISTWVGKTYQLDGLLLHDLTTLQKHQIINVHHLIVKQYPKKLSLNHDIIGYLIDDSPLHTPVNLSIEVSQMTIRHQKHFFQMLHWARRRAFIFTKINKI